MMGKPSGKGALITTGEAARVAGIARSSPIERAINKRGLPAFQVYDRTVPTGKRWMLYRDDLAEWMKTHKFRRDIGVVREPKDNGQAGGEMVDSLKASVKGRKVTTTPRGKGKKDSVDRKALLQQIGKVEFELGELRYMLTRYEDDHDAKVQEVVQKAIEGVFKTSGSDR